MAAHAHITNSSPPGQGVPTFEPIATGDHPLTSAEAAVMGFDPWDIANHPWQPPSNVEWADLANPYLVTVRLAWRLLGMTKSEVVEAIEMLESDGHADLVENLADRMADAIEFFGNFAKVLDVASARHIVALATAVHQSDISVKEVA